MRAIEPGDGWTWLHTRPSNAMRSPVSAAKNSAANATSGAKRCPRIASLVRAEFTSFSSHFWHLTRMSAASPSSSSGSRALRLALIAAFLALAVGAVLLRNLRMIGFHLHPKRFVAVEPGLLFRSGELSPRLVHDVLERNRIRKGVWMLYYDERKSSHRAEKAAIEALGIERVNLSLHGDGTGKVGRYVDALAEVAESVCAGDAVLVQCASGSRRSGGVIALFLLLVEGRSPGEAYRELDRFGSHPVAETPLLAYLNLNMGEIARRLAARGVIERAPSPLPLLRPPPRDTRPTPPGSLRLPPHF